MVRHSHCRRARKTTTPSIGPEMSIFERVWCLLVAAKPVQFIPVDFPNVGKMDRKTVWYMVYSVTNTGQFVGSGVSSAKETRSITPSRHLRQGNAR